MVTFIAEACAQICVLTFHLFVTVEHDRVVAVGRELPAGGRVKVLEEVAALGRAQAFRAARLAFQQHLTELRQAAAGSAREL